MSFLLKHPSPSVHIPCSLRASVPLFQEALLTIPPFPSPPPPPRPGPRLSIVQSGCYPHIALFLRTPSSQMACELLEAGILSSAHLGSPLTTPGCLALGTYLHASHCQRVLQPVLPILLGIRVQEHVAHLGRRKPHHTSLGPRRLCWASVLRITEHWAHRHPAFPIGPHERAEQPWAKTKAPSPQFHS